MLLATSELHGFEGFVGFVWFGFSFFTWPNCSIIEKYLGVNTM